MSKRSLARRGLACVSLVTLPALAAAQTETTPDEKVNDRLDRLEKENAELQRKFDMLAAEQQDNLLSSLVPAMGDGQKGLAPAASKVYLVDQGVSIGGYGEAIYQNFAGDKIDQADFLRAILYFGYRFNEAWIFNSEIEFEHASTGAGGEASVEFAYLEYNASTTFGVRAGLLLVPMGFINELHEPQTFLGATRPETETRIIPSTWRENGVGVFGEAGPITYRAYVLNGLDATGFSDKGLRGGRQKGSRAKAEDLAFVARADWTDTPGVLVGGSVYYGNSGQEQAGLGDTTTTIAEAHGELRTGGLWARGLYAFASVDDVAELNAARFAADPNLTAADSVGEELRGGYVELGYDILPLMKGLKSKATSSLSPFVRYEMIETQADVPAGFMMRQRNDFDVLTVGFAYQPIDNVIVKLDFQDYGDGNDRVSLTMGYAF